MPVSATRYVRERAFSDVPASGSSACEERASLGRAGEGLELVLGCRADVAAAAVVSGVFSADGACDGLGSLHDAPAEHFDGFAGRAGGDVVRLVAQPAA